MPPNKAHFVSKGYAKDEGIDFDEMFLPLVNMTTLCTLLGLVAIENIEFVQSYVKIAFLHGYLHEEVYMQLLESFF